MKKARTVLALGVSVAAAIALVVLLVMPGYATIMGNTYNEDNSATVRYITVSLGNDQYSEAVSSTIKYMTRTEITDSGRTVQYVPDHEDHITVNAVTYDVTEIVTFEITLDTSKVILPYNLQISVDDPSKMTGDFYIKVTDEYGSVNYVFPTNTGITLSNLSVDNLEVTFFVHAVQPAIGIEPDPPLDDVAFKFRAEVSTS